MNINNKTFIIVGIVLIAVSFYGGMKYGQSRIGRGVNFAQNTRGGFRTINGTNENTAFAMGGLVNGQILSKDANSITIKTRDGGSKIVLVSSSTPVSKSVTGKISDLTVGEEVVASGTQNQDGSVTAKNIQTRPAGTPFMMRAQ